jgi:hydroxylaminobenzene mutase
MENANRRLMWYGMLLFLLGLVTGLLEQRFTNMRMGVSAHLEGVMNGTFLLVLGAVWTEVKLPPPAETAAYWTALYGTYMNWVTTTFAAVFGTAAANPISSAGHHGQPWQESLAAAGFLSVSIAIIAASLLVLWGLRPQPRSSQ